MITTRIKFLNRFTTIPFAIDLLTRKQLTLLNPTFWEDSNDRITMELYRKKKNKQSIYALCLTDERETIHHWNAFANGTSGCCIEFNYNKLLDCIAEVNGVSYGKTKYIKIKDLNLLDNKIEQLPYLKRDLFQSEREYRIVVLSDERQQATLDIPIAIDTITRTTISNKMPNVVFKSLKEGLLKISSDFTGKIFHSTLFNNTIWSNHFNKLYVSKQL